MVDADKDARRLKNILGEIKICQNIEDVIKISNEIYNIAERAVLEISSLKEDNQKLREEIEDLEELISPSLIKILRWLRR